MERECGFVSGIDEAGRGCVIGPLAVAGVEIDARRIPELERLGVTDSKRLSPRKREELSRCIEETARSFRVLLCPPEEIDRYCARHGLDILEAEKFARIIGELRMQEVYVDAPGRGGRRFRELLYSLVPDPSVRIVAENHADLNYTVVGAASILAKVRRDREIEVLRQQVGDFGSGYPSDPKTREFLSRILAQGPPPPWVRKTWKTVEKLRPAASWEF